MKLPDYTKNSIVDGVFDHRKSSLTAALFTELEDILPCDVTFYEFKRAEFKKYLTKFDLEEHKGRYKKMSS